MKSTQACALTRTASCLRAAGPGSVRKTLESALLGSVCGPSFTATNVRMQSPTAVSLQGSRSTCSRAELCGCPATKAYRKTYILRLLFAWLVTVALSGAIYYTLYIYSDVVPIMGKQTKKEFNTLITAFSILLSLNVSGFVDRTIRDARWWFLSVRFRPRRTVSKD